MRYILGVFFPLFVFAQSSFITPLEYASSLYKNPRGIGCNRCHGENGEGMVIANYTHKKQKRSFKAPKINDKSFKELYKALNSRQIGMPRYFLTQGEIKALYLYLHRNDKAKKDAK